MGTRPKRKSKSGLVYAVRYKDPDNPKFRLTSQTSTNTDIEAEAIAFAIQNKDAIIERYKAKKARKEAKKGGEAFYRMLREYYVPGGGL